MLLLSLWLWPVCLGYTLVMFTDRQKGLLVRGYTVSGLNNEQNKERSLYTRIFHDQFTAGQLESEPKDFIIAYLFKPGLNLQVQVKYPPSKKKGSTTDNYCVLNYHVDNNYAVC